MDAGARGNIQAFSNTISASEVEHYVEDLLNRGYKIEAIAPKTFLKETRVLSTVRDYMVFYSKDHG